MVVKIVIGKWLSSLSSSYQRKKEMKSNQQPLDSGGELLFNLKLVQAIIYCSDNIEYFVIIIFGLKELTQLFPEHCS